MTTSDRELGMDRAITRRDFLNGVSVAIGSTVVNGGVAAADASARQGPLGSVYPPALTGMRGNDPSSITVGHSMRDGQTWESGEDVGEIYDLIVVGAGMSGLAAAYFFKKKAGPNAKVLILDNHDDFGGHARRNEFTVAGRTLITQRGAPSSSTDRGPSHRKDVNCLKTLASITTTRATRSTRSSTSHLGSNRACISTRRRSGPTGW